MRDLEAGCEIFRVERCFVAVLNKERMGDCCGNCIRGASTDGGGEMKACTGCKQVWYCGKVSEEYFSVLASIFYV